MTTIDVSTTPKQSGKRPLVIATTLSFGALIMYWAHAWTFSTVLTGALLGLTIVLDVLVLWNHRTTRVSRKLGLYEALKAFLLLLYVFGSRILESSPVAAKICSGVALIGALAMTVGLMDTARAMIRERNPQRHTGLWELLTDKVIALTGLVIAFLHITYALTFALAFSDRFVGGQLYAVQLKPDPEATVAASLPPDCAEEPLCAADQDKTKWRFFFGQSSATLPCTLRLKAVADADKSLRRAICGNGVDAGIDSLKNTPDAECDQPADAEYLRRAAAWNIRELYELRTYFRQKLACDRKSAAYLVEIRGHANDTALKQDPVLAYGSNYEISKQRADQIELLLNEIAREAYRDVGAPAIRWLSYGVSSESSFLDPNGRAWIDAKLDKKLSVEVYVQPVGHSFEERHLRDARTTERKLELIDYLYFTVYTITTTGYGDIIPTSSYAKFIVTLANLIELLFFVVLVNVIANTRAGVPVAPNGTSEGDGHANDA